MKKIALWITLAACGVATISFARVVRPAPDIAWIGPGGKTRNLASLRGHPVILLIARSPRDGGFRARVRALEAAYQRFAARELVCFAAFTEESGPVESNIPFVVASDGPRVAFLYDVTQGSAVAIIGPDGNLDYLTTKRLSPQRMLDVMGANFEIQTNLRRPAGPPGEGL